MSRSGKFDLTEGPILSRLLSVALPIMGSSLLQMLYNLTDMFWLGRLSSDDVAASGSGGMFLWLSMAFMMLGRMGAEIGVSQNLGRKDEKAARSFSQTALGLAGILGLIYGATLFFGSKSLLGIFNIQEANVLEAASIYLSIVGLGVPVSFLTGVFVGTFNGSGYSRISFFANLLGLIVNVILDPVMIFTLNWGIAGAAIATVFAQICSFLVFAWAIKRDANRPFIEYSFFTMPEWAKVKQIVKWCAPISLESMLFTSLAMLVSRLVYGFGSNAVAAQSVGSQVESLTWMIGGGFSSALTAFIGQNFGAGKWQRIRKGVNLAILSMTCWGIAVTILIYTQGAFLISLFMPDPNIIAIGVSYLQVLAYSQVTGCWEGVASGAFRGIGITIPPSIISISCNALRVPLAYYLAGTDLGLNGVWWAVAISAALRGSIMLIAFLMNLAKQPKDDIISVG